VETKAEIVSAAWVLARQKGLAGLSMRDLGDRVGMRAQSVYSYFSSKDEIYDAMFRQGYEECLAAMGTPDDSGVDPVTAMKADAGRFFRFCTSDAVRYQLLFQRSIPGFEPSAESYAVAVQALGRMQDGPTRAGIVDPAALDLITAVFAGLSSQQVANDPGGHRWEGLVDRSVEMVLRDVAPHLLDAQESTPRPTTRRSP
jgi:AcrR family transcriptional regulator